MRKYSRQNSLSFIHFVVLHLLARQDEPVQQIWLYRSIGKGDAIRHEGAVNAWLERHGVPVPLVTFHIRSKTTLAHLLADLEKMELTSRDVKGSITITDKGRSLMKKLGPDWRNWFTTLPHSLELNKGQRVRRILEVV